MNDTQKDALEIKVHESADSLKLSFKGAITELAKIHAVDLKQKSTLFLDFNDISYINSAGVRRWVLWMWNIEKEFPILKIVIERCPMVISKQIIAVMKFVPKMTQIRSFYIPFFCESCELSSVKMFDSKPLLGLSDDAFGERFSSITCSTCGSAILMDASVEQLNRFINTYRTE